MFGESQCSYVESPNNKLLVIMTELLIYAGLMKTNMEKGAPIWSPALLYDKLQARVRFSSWWSVKLPTPLYKYSLPLLKLSSAAVMQKNA